jgi:carboxyl-terminal processing protease
MRIAALAALLLASKAVADAPCQPVVEYDAITAVVTERFYDRTFRGLDWPSRVASLRAQVTCEDDATAVALKVNRLLSELRASHTGLFTKNDLDYWALQSIFSRSLDKFPVDFSGLWPAQRDGKWYAKYVLPGSAAYAAGVQQGDELISVDGQPFRPLGISSTSASTLTLSQDGRTRRSVQIQARTHGMQQFFLDATRESTRIVPIGKRATGYFHLWAGTNEVFLNSMNTAMEEFEAKQVDALILDLRGGFGGAGLEYLAKVKSSPHLSKVPRYVLIDDGVRSGKEWLAATVRVEKLGTLVGSKTAGMFLGGAPHRFFDNKYLLYLAEHTFTPPGIGEIEGIGVAPDVAVEPCRVYCAGADPQLGKVIELIRALQ